MEEFLNKLYGYEYFTTYLIIALVVLIVLFFIILFFGKKDQKKREIEATKKLQQIQEEDAFREEFEKGEKLETPIKDEEQKLENDTIMVPTIDSIQLQDKENNEQSVDMNEKIDIGEPEIPDIEQMTFGPSPEEVDNIKEESLNTMEALHNEEPSIELNKENQLIEAPILDRIDEKPFVFNEEESLEIKEEPSNLFSEQIDNEFKEEVVEKVAMSKEENVVPNFNFDDVLKSVETAKSEEAHRAPEVFSSVYAPSKDDIKNTQESVSNDDLDIELPSLKKKIDVEKNEIEVPKLNDYNLDSLAGETYTINK